MDDLGSQITENATIIAVTDVMEREKDALREILVFLVPEKIKISWEDIVKGYSKERTIERIMKGAENDPQMTSLRLRTVFTMLKRCYETPPKIEVFLNVVASVHGDSVDTERP